MRLTGSTRRTRPRVSVRSRASCCPQDCGRDRRRHQSRDGKTMSGFRPPLLKATVAKAGSDPTPGTWFLGHTEVLECTLGKRPKGGSQAQKADRSLRVLARSNCGRGEVGRRRVQANEDAPRYRVGAVADRTRQHVQIDQREQVERAFRHCPSVYEIADKRPNNKEFTACKDWRLRSQS
jgi:hypothetical protein